jgi:uncharacterized protein (DUF488 family)
VTGLVTVGHGTADRTALGELLTTAGVRMVVDIRIAPGSRRNPDVARAALSEWLPALTISYRWDRRLGGFRRPPTDSPDVALRNVSFRGYASWMRSADFQAAVAELLDDASRICTTVMCSESVWWRCHRRLVADFVTLARRVPVSHLMHDGRLEPHRPTAGVRLCEDGLLVYDATTAPDDPAEAALC